MSRLARKEKRQGDETICRCRRGKIEIDQSYHESGSFKIPSFQNSRLLLLVRRTMSPPFDSWAADHSFPNQKPSSQPQKKPRHRHSPAQLAALNELFDQNEHPPLEHRTTLAERLGMYVSRPFFFVSVMMAISGKQRPSMLGFKINEPHQRNAYGVVLRHVRPNV